MFNVFYQALLRSIQSMIFYTYMWLREDGTPWYVGKGTGRRAYKSAKGHRVPRDKSLVLIQEYPDEATAFAAETFFISFYGRIDLGTGCLRNLTNGGEGTSGTVPSNETRLNISVALKGNKNSLGVKRSQETKLRQSISLKGKKKLRTLEHSRKIGLSQKGRAWSAARRKAYERQNDDRRNRRESEV